MSILSEEVLHEKEIRLKKIDKMMADLGLDAILCTSTSQMSYQVHVKYIAKMTLQTRRAFVFKEIDKEPALFLPMSVSKDTFYNRSWIEKENLYLGNMLPNVLACIEKLPQQKPRIGWATPDEIPHDIYNVLTGTKAEFVDITKEFTIVRANKSEYEIKMTQLSSDLAVASFEDLIRRIEVGKTEIELLGGAIGFLAEHGAEEQLLLAQSKKPFSFIKMPQDVPLTETDIFVYSAEFGGPGGYWTQLIRPIFMDKKTHLDAYEIWKAVLEAEQAAVDVMHPGNRVCDIHFAIEAVINKYGMRMSYWAGHGMGADLGDGVDIGPENNMIIVPNMVLTLQPSIDSDTNSILYGNTFLSRETGEAINLTGKYMDTPYYEDLYNMIVNGAKA